MYLKSLQYTQDHLDFLLCYLQGVQRFYILHLGLWCNSLHFVKNIRSVSRFIFFAYRCPVVPATFVVKTVFAPLHCFCSSIKDQLIILMWTYFWVLCSISFIYLSFLSLIPHYLDYYSFIVNLEVGWCQSSIFVLLLQYSVGFSKYFVSPYKLYNQFVDIHEIINILTTAALNL